MSNNDLKARAAHTIEYNTAKTDREYRGMIADLLQAIADIELENATLVIDRDAWRKTAENNVRQHARTLTQIGADKESLLEYMDKMAVLERENAELKSDSKDCVACAKEAAGRIKELEEYQINSVQTTLDQVADAHQENANLLNLVAAHCRHWTAIGVCCGGVDGDVEDPIGNAGSIKKVIADLKLENERLKASFADVYGVEAGRQAECELIVAREHITRLEEGNSEDIKHAEEIARKQAAEESLQFMDAITQIHARKHFNI